MMTFRKSFALKEYKYLYHIRRQRFSTNTVFFSPKYTISLLIFGGSTSLITYGLMSNNINNVPNNKEYCPDWDYNWDGLKTDESTKLYTKTITFIRHGQYISAENDEDKILTDIGREQALVTGKRLANMDIIYDKIICSKLTRAIETTDIIYNELIKNDKYSNGIDIIYDADLNEGKPIICIPFDEKRRDRDKWNELIERDSDRINNGFNKYIKRSTLKNENILYIGHGNVIRYYMCKILQIPGQAWLRWSINNCSISTAKLSKSGTNGIRRWSDVGHFDDRLKTTH